MGAHALLERSRKVKQLLPQIGVDAVIATQDQFIEYNVDQMKRGEMADGTQIGRYKSASYALRKYRQNPLAGEGNVDLIDKKDFIKGITLRKSGNQIEETSWDWKYRILTEKYGEKILGIQPKNLPSYRRTAFIPEVRKKVTEIYNG